MFGLLQEHFYLPKEEQKVRKKELNKRLQEQIEIFIEFREEQKDFVRKSNYWKNIRPKTEIKLKSVKPKKNQIMVLRKKTQKTKKTILTNAKKKTQKKTRKFIINGVVIATATSKMICPDEDKF